MNELITNIELLQGVERTFHKWSILFGNGFPAAPPVPSTGSADLDETIKRLMTILFVLGIVSAISGFIMLGNMFIWPSRKDKGKEHGPWVVLGALILFGAGGIVTFLAGMKLI